MVDLPEELQGTRRTIAPQTLRAVLSRRTSGRVNITSSDVVRRTSTSRLSPSMLQSSGGGHETPVGWSPDGASLLDNSWRGFVHVGRSKQQIRPWRRDHDAVPSVCYTVAGANHNKLRACRLWGENLVDSYGGTSIDHRMMPPVRDSQIITRRRLAQQSAHPGSTLTAKQVRVRHASIFVHAHLERRQPSHPA